MNLKSICCLWQILGINVLSKYKRYKRLTVLRSLDVMKRSRELNVLSEELDKMKKLDFQLKNLINDSEVTNKNNEISARELIHRKTFCKKIMDQLDITKNRSDFLENESKNARLALGKANKEKHRIDDKTRYHYMKEKNDLENKIYESTNFLRKK